MELLAYRFYLKPKGKNLFNGMFFGTDNMKLKLRIDVKTKLIKGEKRSHDLKLGFFMYHTAFIKMKDFRRTILL